MADVMPLQSGESLEPRPAPNADPRYDVRVREPSVDPRDGRGPDTLRAIRGVREARQRLPTSLKLSTILAVLMVMVLVGAAISFSLVARFFGQTLADELLISAGIACLLAVLAGLLFVRFYFGPVVRFAEEILRKFQQLTGTLEQRVAERTAALADSNARLRGTLDQNRTMQQQIVDASRRAGMADVATSVIHNVGNVLNSVNVSAGVVIERVRQSRVRGLKQLAALLREHESDWVNFLSNDDKGRKLPAYLEALAQAADEDQAVIVSELESLQSNVDHIKAVITRQQSQAKQALGVVESVSLANLVDEALKLAFPRALSTEGQPGHATNIVRSYDDMPRVKVDRHKLFQTLANLLGNARDAIDTAGLADDATERRGPGCVTVEIKRAGPMRFSIEITDNGCGILADDLARIFTFGFSTKPGGHGFGLHASAIATAEMGGTLTAHSAGLGQGATFRIELPFRAPGSGTGSEDFSSSLETTPIPVPVR
jgi:signal transduction histidine kinase